MVIQDDDTKRKMAFVKGNRPTNFEEINRKSNFLSNLWTVISYHCRQGGGCFAFGRSFNGFRRERHTR